VREAAFVIPGDLATPTGGYIYDREVIARAPRFGVTLGHVALPGSYPFPKPEDLEETRRLIRATAPGTLLLIDGLAFGAMPLDLVLGFERPIVALVHHPLGYETGLTEQQARALVASERAVLALAKRVIATSDVTARLLVAEYGVPAGRITVAEPGTDPAARAEGTGDPVMLLAVGAVSPR